MTENQLRQQLVSKAESYIGTKEGSAKHKEIVDIYNSHKPLARSYALKYTDAWCAGFVSAMSIACGMTDIIPTEVGCGKHIDLFKKINSWQESDAYVPKVGDIMFYDWNDSGIGDNVGGSDHVGIVAKVVGKTITVIEGNMGSNSVVGYRTMSVNGKYIRGYGVPKYASKATPAAKKTIDQLAQEVLAGKWGIGADRRKRLEAAGYDYDAVQKAVNAKLNPKPTTTTKKETVMVELRVLSEGMTGNDVRQAMLILKDRGYYTATIPKNDNSFGPKMKKAVIAFQKAENLDQDAIIGKDTWSRLLEK